jgi:hypothetical protein
MPTDFRSGKVFPRRGRDELGGFLWLRRVFDKARASRDGTIHDYIYNCGTDQGMFNAWGITVEDFSSAADAAKSDDDILKWAKGRISDSGREAGNKWLTENKTPNMDKQDAEEGVTSAA